MAVSSRASEQRALARLATLDPAPRPRRARPELRLVETPVTPAARRRRAGALALAGAAALLVALLAVAVAQAVVVERQARLDRLDRALAESTVRYERLRLEVAQQESPARVIERARQELGMVTPEELTHVTPPPGSPPVPAAGAPSGGVDTWSRLKPDLAPAP
jgi:cell division protein FtsL